ncbi:MAG: heme o synthase [Phycisphaeraceae bacterium]|nr:heme o synthase [Phycisphaeraceae bacterium]
MTSATSTSAPMQAPGSPRDGTVELIGAAPLAANLDAADAQRSERRFLSVWAALSKARLSALVVLTTAVGYAAAPTPDRAWLAFMGTVLGTALAAAAAAMLNQLIETRRDGLMVRTRGRPLPAGAVSPVVVFVVGVVAAYLGVSMVALFGNLLAAGLTLFTILLYILLYTPLKPLTTFNTLIGAITGATPPMIGWAAATGSLEPGAWILGAILFVWQIPHFFALAWIYRDDYRRGGFAMLPVLDASGRTTAEIVLLTSLLLIPVALLATMFGVAGWWFAAGSLLLGLWLSALAVRFRISRTTAAARAVFIGSIVYLPLLLILLVADRGPVGPHAALRGGSSFAVDVPAP